MNDQRCENCRFWDEWGGEPREIPTADGIIQLFREHGLEHDKMSPNEYFRGFCKRYPPLIRSLDEAEGFVCPHTQGEDWCGEWQGKEQHTTHGDTTCNADA